MYVYYVYDFGLSRALDDIMESIAELKYYRETIFKTDVYMH